MMKLFKRRQPEPWETYDPVTYEAKVKAVDTAAAARFSRGGVRGQFGSVLTQSEFDGEMDELKLRVERGK